MSDFSSDENIVEDFLSNEQKIKEMGVSINALLNTLVRKNNIDTHSISHRVKTSISLENKIQKKKKYKNLKDITDILGFRIITFYSSDIDDIEILIRKEFIIDEENSIDKRKAIEPDRFGYMSLHYIVSLKEERSSLPEYSDFSDYKFEIQIRTILQHCWAEIEHKLGYKSKNSMPDEIRRLFSILSGNLELVDKEFLNIKRKIYEYDETVRGEVINSRAGDILINEMSLTALIDSDSDLESEYCKYKKLAKDSGLDVNEISTNEIEFFHIQEGVEILKLLDLKYIGELQIIIKKSVSKNAIKNVLLLNKRIRPNRAYVKYTLFMFLVYINYYSEKKNLSPLVNVWSNVGDFEKNFYDIQV
ncbi:GTP pyrophosphokinase family protein [Pectobacterium carotovorum]|uniref:GTP pyrophosphokinase n=1 Tax=Pectobacterium carotovorum TaxID=554 RepID=UPI00068BD59C|nr:hypothetical protein [Pectobacterium carotovorum]SHG14017.1 ppGpp synthetase catalytic domain-containing protein (RelA/SpoT-type nucleotidyltranferase) [Pectobacterium carotovorum]